MSILSDGRYPEANRSALKAVAQGTGVRCDRGSAS